MCFDLLFLSCLAIGLEGWSLFEWRFGVTCVFCLFRGLLLGLGVAFHICLVWVCVVLLIVNAYFRCLLCAC